MAKHRAVRVCMAYLSLCLAALALCPSAAQARKCTMKDIDVSMRTDRPYAKIPADCTEISLRNKNDGKEDPIKGAGARALAAGLSTHDGVTKLGIWHHQLGDDGAYAIASLLEMSRSPLSSITLGYNQIGNYGAQTLARALEASTTDVTGLDLRWNQIEDKGAKALAKMLATNTVLTDLNLRSNRIQDQGGKAIAEALTTNRKGSKITKLALGGNSLSADVNIALSDALDAVSDEQDDQRYDKAKKRLEEQKARARAEL